MLCLSCAGALQDDAEVYGEFQSSKVSNPVSVPQVTGHTASDEAPSLLADDRSLVRSDHWVHLTLLECLCVYLAKVSA